MRYGPDDVTTVTVAFGDYWGRFGDQYLTMAEALDPAPARMIVVTDVPREGSGRVDTVCAGEGLHIADYWNYGNSLVDTEWVWGHGFDDLMYPSAFDGFDSDADCHGFAQMQTGDFTGVVKYEGGFEGMHLERGNPMYGAYFHRTTLMWEMPYRPLNLIDWAHFSEMSYFGKTVDTENKVIGTWARRADSWSGASAPFVQELFQWQDALSQGRVSRPGAPVS